MLKLPLHFDLGADLRRHRKTARITQTDLARKSGLSVPTIRLLETGRGNLDSFPAVLELLDLELTGRNLPAGASLGKRLATLRRHRHVSQRTLAELIDVTQPTVVALERREQGRLSTLERALVVLGAGAYLTPRGQARSFYTHAGNSSTNHAWETPAELLQALHGVFGRFDLWHGTVFINPPYGRGLAMWVAKARREVEEGRAKTVVAVLPARPDTAYWHEHIAGHATVYFLRGRLRFGDGAQSAPFPSALAVWGAETETVTALDAVLSSAWRAG